MVKEIVWTEDKRSRYSTSYLGRVNKHLLFSISWDGITPSGTNIGRWLLNTYLPMKFKNNRFHTVEAAKEQADNGLKYFHAVISEED